MAVSEELRIVVKAEVNKAVSNLKKFQTQTKKTGTDVGRQLKSMALGFASVTAAVMAVRKAWQFISEAAKMAATVNQVGAALESLAEHSGVAADSMLKDLSEAAGHTINMLDLMKQASRALVFNIPADKLAELMRIARASATATGESVEYMFNSLVTGVARSSRMLLDNLGIIVDTEKATKDYAAQIGKTVEELTAAERSQATLNAVLENGQDIMERVGKAGQELTDLEKWQQMEAAIVDIKAELGQNFVQYFADAAQWAAELLRNMVQAQKQLRTVRASIAGKSDESIAAQLAAAQARLEKARNASDIAILRTLVQRLERQLAEEQRMMTSGLGAGTAFTPLKVEGGGASSVPNTLEEIAEKTKEVNEAERQLLATEGSLAAAQQNRIPIVAESTRVWAAGVDEVAEAIARLEDASVGVGDVFASIGPLFEGMGAAMIKGASALGEGFKSAIVGIIKTLAQFWATTGVGFIALGQVGKGANLLAASAAAQVAAGLIGAIELAQGGIVTSPTTALIGERGPEAVIPLSKMGGMGDTIIIQGDMLTQEEAYNGDTVPAEAGAELLDGIP